jgi:hypothetical protein
MSGDTLAAGGHHNVGSARVTLHLGSALLVWFLLASQSTVSLATRAFPRQYGRNEGLFTERSGLSDEALLGSLLERFGPTVTNKFILIISWFNLMSRYLLSTRVPLEVTNKIEGRTAPI